MPPVTIQMIVSYYLEGTIVVNEPEFFVKPLAANGSALYTYTTADDWQTVLSTGNGARNVAIEQAQNSIREQAATANADLSTFVFVSQETERYQIFCAPAAPQPLIDDVKPTLRSLRDVLHSEDMPTTVD